MKFDLNSIMAGAITAALGVAFYEYVIKPALDKGTTA